MAETSDNSEIRADGVLINAITGLGTKRDKSAYYGLQTESHMSETELEALYYDPLCRRVVDVPAEAALAKPPKSSMSAPPSASVPSALVL